MSNPNRNGDVLQLSAELWEYQETLIRNLGVPNGLIGLDLLDLPSPYNTIHRINSLVDGSFEAIDRQGEHVALLTIESAVALHTKYGVTLGEQAQKRVRAFLKGGLKSLAQDLFREIGVVGPWKPR